MATDVKKLEENVQSQLRSDLTTHSIANCVMELVENAIDAQSTSIAIRINLRKFQLQVIDNGTGITRDQLKTIGKRNCTSKWSSKSKSKLFGYRGESLANLRKSCDHLLIVTKTAESKTTFCKEFNSDGSCRIEEALQERICRGTTVVAKNVLGKTPVRQARIIPHVEFQNLKQYIRATAIMHPLICFSLEDSSKSVEILRIKRAKTTQKQLKNLYPEIHANSTMLQLVSEKGNIRIKAIVSNRMCKYECVRFVFVNKRYVAKSDIEKFFKKYLQKCFRELRMKEALEVRSRWQPVFVLNITCPQNEYSLQFELNKRHVEFKNRHVVNHCLVELVNEFRRTLGLEKTSLTHRAQTANADIMNKKNTFTFIDGRLFKKLKDATTLFGIPTTRTEVQRYRRSRYQTNKEHLLHENKRSRCDRDKNAVKRLEKDVRTASAARSPGWLGPEFQGSSVDIKGAEDEDIFDNVFRVSNECDAIGTCHRDARETNAAANRTSNENTRRSENDHQTKKARVSNTEERREREPLQQYVASNDAVGAEEDILCRSRAQRNEEREQFLIEDDGAFGAAVTNHVTRTPSNVAEYEPLPASIEHGKAFPAPTNVPNSPQPKWTANVFETLTIENEAIEENDVQDNSLLAPSVARMIMNCVQQKRDNDTEGERNENSSFVQQSRPTKKILLRDSKLKVRGPFDSEFTLKPTDKTFVNYLEQRSTGSGDVTQDVCVRQPFPESCLRTSDMSRYVDSEMMKLTLRTRTLGPERPFYLGQDNASPECYCSCHRVDNENVRARESHCGENEFCNQIQTIISKPPLTPASNQQIFLPAENLPSIKSVTHDFPFTPYVASPYFLGTASACEGENVAKDVPIPPTSDRPPDETATNRRQNNSPILRVLDNSSLTMLKKKTKYKRNCNMLSTAGAVDVPSGMLEAMRRPSNRKSAVSRAIGDDFHKIVKPYSVKNHYTLDDDGQSCLRVFPHLRKNDERPTTNSLTIPEELNSFLPFTKTDLHNIEFLAQLDRKFLLTIMRQVDTNEEIIVIFDQHAVDERIRLEQLFETYADKHGVWRSTSVNPAIYPDVASSDIHILGDFRTQFEEKGLYFKFNGGDARSTQRFLIAVVKVPTCLHSKAMRESSPYDFASKLTELVGSLIKEMVELLREPLCPVRNVLPQTLCEALNYEACRGAIKFGDKLSEKVCATLLKKVSNCECPFQCAHGRPLLAPLVSLTKIETFMATRSSARRCPARTFGRLLDVRNRFEERDLS